MKEEKFHYKIRKYLGKNDGQCEEEIVAKFHFFRCHNKAKGNIGTANLCGIHSRSLKKWREI